MPAMDALHPRIAGMARSYDIGNGIQASGNSEYGIV